MLEYIPSAPAPALSEAEALAQRLAVIKRLAELCGDNRPLSEITANAELKLGKASVQRLKACCLYKFFGYGDKLDLAGLLALPMNKFQECLGPRIPGRRSRGYTLSRVIDELYDGAFNAVPPRPGNEKGRGIMNVHRTHEMHQAIRQKAQTIADVLGMRANVFLSEVASKCPELVNLDPDKLGARLPYIAAVLAANGATCDFARGIKRTPELLRHDAPILMVVAVYKKLGLKHNWSLSRSFRHTKELRAEIAAHAALQGDVFDGDVVEGYYQRYFSAPQRGATVLPKPERPQPHV